MEKGYEILPEDYPNYDLSFKVIVIGNSGVGKSCLSVKATKNIFTESYSATIGFEFFTFNIKLNNNKEISTSHFNLIPKQIHKLPCDIKSNLFAHLDKWYQCKIIKTKEKGSTYLRLYSDDTESKYDHSLLYIAIKKQNGSNYEIENVEHSEIVSVVKWNMFGNEFIVNDCNDNDILLMNYSFSIKGLTGPSKMKIVLLQSCESN